MSFLARRRRAMSPGHDPAVTRRLLMPFLKPQWPALAGAAGSTIVLTLVELAKPWPLALALDQIVRIAQAAV